MGAEPEGRGSMRIFSVGGSVRDELLGLPVKDRDWVVVGATPGEMERRGYKPVGRDFPVFLHPQTHEEYALARTERKVARGYKGFAVHAAPDVTLEQDLERRDLTINAMARDEEGALIDPHGGERDLRSGILRHVSAAFSEDPVRILRVARFAARFRFRIAPETLALMRAMVDCGEADALVAERVWQEFARGLMEDDPWRMLAVLAATGLLARWLPELAIAVEDADGRDAGWSPADEPSAVVAHALGYAAAEGWPLPVRFAIALRGARGGAAQGTAAIEEVCARMRVPAECRELALLAQRHLALAMRAAEAAPAELLLLLEASDAFRRPQRMEELLRTAQAEAFGARRWVDVPYPHRRAALAALVAARSVDAAALAAQGGDIGARLREARLARLESAMAAPR
jgi:tRNA nucleotidyltransferase (CCA-adding enzyme)